MNQRKFAAIVGILIFVVGMYFIVTKQKTSDEPSTPTPSTSKVSANSPIGVATNFYTAYELCLTTPPDEAADQVSIYCQANTGLTSPNFVSNLETGGVAATGADPVLCAQNVPEVIKAQAVQDETPTSARVSMQLTFGETNQVNSVDLVNEDGDWKVDNVVCPTL